MQAISIAAAGMMAAADRLNASAHRLASADAQAKVDHVQERVGQIGAATDFKANAAVLKTADEMAGALLNLKV